MVRRLNVESSQEGDSCGIKCCTTVPSDDNVRKVSSESLNLTNLFLAIACSTLLQHNEAGQSMQIFPVNYITVATTDPIILCVQPITFIDLKSNK